MSKIVLNSSRNGLSTEGIIDSISSKVDQSLRTTSDVTFQKVTAGDLVVMGNADIKGEMTFIESNVLKIKDNMIELNDTNEPLRLAGVQFNRGPSLAPYRLLYDEQDHSLKSGFSNETPSRLAHCEDSPEDGGLAVWNSTSNRFNVRRILEGTVSHRTRLTLLGGLVFEEGANVPSVYGDTLGNVVIRPRGSLVMEGAPGSTVQMSLPLLFSADGSCKIESESTGVLNISADEVCLSNVLRLGNTSMGNSSSVYSEADGLHVQGRALVLGENTALLTRDNEISFGPNQEASIGYEVLPHGRLVLSSDSTVEINAPLLQAQGLHIRHASGTAGGMIMASDGHVNLSSSTGIFGSDSHFELGPSRRIMFSDAPGSFVSTSGDHLVVQGSRGIVLSAADGGVKITGGGALKLRTAEISENVSGDMVISAPGFVVMPRAKAQSVTIGESSRLIETSDGLVLSSAGNVVMSQPLKILQSAVFGNGPSNASIARSTVNGELVIRNVGKISLSSTDQVNVGARLSWSNLGSIVTDGSGLSLLSPGTIKCKAQLFDAINISAANVQSSAVTSGVGQFESVETDALKVHSAIETSGVRWAGTMHIVGDRIEMSNSGATGTAALIVQDSSVALCETRFDAYGVVGKSATWEDIGCTTLTVANCMEAAEDGGVAFSTPVTLHEGLLVPGVLDMNASGVTAHLPLDCKRYVHVHETLAVDGSSTFHGAVTLENELDVSGHRITNLGSPRNAGDAVSKRYLDSIAMGFRVLESVQAASSSQISLSQSAPVVTDGHSLAVGDRVLLFGQTDGRENGIYVVGATALTRAADMSDAAVDVSGSSVFVMHGVQYSGYGFVVSSRTARRSVLLTQDVMIWNVYSGITQVNASGGLTKVGNDITLDLDPSSLVLSTAGKVTLSSSLFGTGLSGGNGMPARVSPIQTQITALGTITQGEWKAGLIDVAHGGTGNTEYTSGAILIGDGTLPIVATDGLTFRSFGSGRKGLAIGTTSSMQGEIHVKGHTPTFYLDGSASGSLVFAIGGQTMSTISADPFEMEVEHENAVTMRAGSSSYLQVTKDAGSRVHGGLTVDTANVAQLMAPLITLGPDSSMAYSSALGIALTGLAITVDADALQIGGLLIESANGPPKIATATPGQPFSLMDGSCPQLTLNGTTVCVPGTLKIGSGTTVITGSGIAGQDPFTISSPLTVAGNLRMGGILWQNLTDNVSLTGTPNAKMSIGVHMSALTQSGDLLFDVNPVQETITLGDVDVRNIRTDMGLGVTTTNAYIGGLHQAGWHFIGKLTGRVIISVASLGRFDIKAQSGSDPDVQFFIDGVTGTQPPGLYVFRANDTGHDAQIFMHVATVPCSVQIIECTHRLGPYIFEGDSTNPDGSTSSFSSAWHKVFDSGTAAPNMSMTGGRATFNRIMVNDVVIGNSLLCRSPAIFEGQYIHWSNSNDDYLHIASTDGTLSQVLAAANGPASFKVSNVAQQSHVTITSNADGNGELTCSGEMVLSAGGSAVATFRPSLVSLSRPLISTQSIGAPIFSGDIVRSAEHRFSDTLTLRATSQGNLELTGGRLTGIGTPMNSSDAVSKSYADSLSYGMIVCGPARLAATTNIDLSQNPPTLIDQVIARVGDLILLPVQTDTGQCGLYRLESFSSPLVRTTFTNPQGKMPYIYVQDGVVYGGTGFAESSPGKFSQLHGPLQMNAGSGLLQTGNLVGIKLRRDGGLVVSGDGLAIDASAAGLGLSGGAGQPLSVSSIAHLDTLGTITRGVWKGTAIGMSGGGTGSNSFTLGSIPYSNGSRLVDGKLRFDPGLQALGINTMQPIEGLTLVDRNILLQRGGASSTSIQFASGSYADAFTYVVRETDSGLQWLCGPPSTLQPVMAIDRAGKINMSAPVKCASMTVGNIIVRGGSLAQVVPGPFNMRHFSSTNEGCMTTWYGSLGQIDSIADSEFMRAGYYNGSYILQTSATGSGVPRNLALQAGTNADQMLLLADGSIIFSGPVSHETSVELLDTLVVHGDATMHAAHVEGDLAVDGRISLASSTQFIHTINDEMAFEADAGCKVRVGTFASIGSNSIALLAGTSVDARLNIGYLTDAMSITTTGGQSKLTISSPGAAITLPASPSSAITMTTTAFTGPVTMSNGLSVAGLTSMADVMVSQGLHISDHVTLRTSPDGTCPLVQATGGGLYVQLSGSITDCMYLGVSTIGNPTGCHVRAPSGRVLSLSSGNTTLTLVDAEGVKTQQPVTLGGSLMVAGPASFSTQVLMTGGARVSRISTDSFQFTSADATTPLHYVTTSLQKSMVPLTVDIAVRNVRALAIGDTFLVDTLNSRVDCMGSQLQNIADPVAPGDAVNKRFLDQYVSGIIVRASVVAASAPSQNIDLTRAVPSLDGTTLIPGDRILLTRQTNAAENGAYVITSQGYATRASDMPLNASAAKYYFFVSSGVTQAGLGYMCINSSGQDVVGTSNLTFTVYISSAPGSHTASVAETCAVQLSTQSGLQVRNGKLSIDPSIAGTNVVFENGVLSVPTLTRDGVPVPVDEGGSGNTVMPTQGLVYSTGNRLESDPDALRYDHVHRCMVLDSPTWSTSNALTCGRDICLTGVDRYLYFADQQTSTYKWRVGTNQARDFVISRGDTQSKASMQEVLRLDANGALVVSGGIVNSAPFGIANGGTGVSQLPINSLVTVSDDGLRLVGTQLTPRSVITGDASGKLSVLQAADFRSFVGLAVGVDLQGFSPLLQQITNLTATTGSFIVGNNGGLSEVHGAAARDALGLGPLAVIPTVDDSVWSGQPLSVQHGGTGSTGVPDQAIVYSDTGKLKGTPSLLWKPDVKTLTLGDGSTPAHFKILGRGSISLAGDENGAWTLGPIAGDPGLSLVSPDGEDVVHFTSSGVQINQAHVIGNFSVGGAVDLASDVTVGGNLLVSQGISSLGGWKILDPDDTDRALVDTEWRGATDGAFLTTSKLTIDTGQANFTGSLEVGSLKVTNAASSSTLAVGHANNVDVIVKRAAYYQHIETSYLTIVAIANAAGPSHFEIEMNDRATPFGLDPLEQATVITSPSLPLTVFAHILPNTKTIAVDWTSAAAETVVLNMQINCHSD